VVSRLSLYGGFCASRYVVHFVSKFRFAVSGVACSDEGLVFLHRTQPEEGAVTSPSPIAPLFKFEVAVSTECHIITRKRAFWIHNPVYPATTPACLAMIFRTLSRRNQPSLRQLVFSAGALPIKTLYATDLPPGRIFVGSNSTRYSRRKRRIIHGLRRRHLKRSRVRFRDQKGT
jgi:hypothetical protein